MRRDVWLQAPRRSLTPRGFDLERRPTCTTVECDDVELEVVEGVEVKQRVVEAALTVAYHVGVLVARLVRVVEDRTRPH